MLIIRLLYLVLLSPVVDNTVTEFANFEMGSRFTWSFSPFANKITCEI